LREPTADPNAFPRHSHFAALWLGFMAFAVYGSLAPFDFEPLAPAVALARFREVLAAPLTIASRSDWAANVLLFMPIGFFGMPPALRIEPVHRPGSSAHSLWRVRASH